ncbi:MAG TPA: hypothetical protein PKV22_07030, partial [Paludibacteraceae bacterium]|nr:hypothetical protein [Paludibacteraceae bacterium]
MKEKKEEAKVVFSRLSESEKATFFSNRMFIKPDFIFVGHRDGPICFIEAKIINGDVEINFGIPGNELNQMHEYHLFHRFIEWSRNRTINSVKCNHPCSGEI